MKRENDEINNPGKYIFFHRIYTGFTVLALVLFSLTTLAQDKQMVQVKTFDSQLKAFGNINIAINGKDYFSMGSKGVTFIELSNEDLPIQSIQVQDKKLETASWTHSKGTIEIIIRKKSYELYKLFVKNTENAGLANLKITFNGKKAIRGTTNSEGIMKLPLPLDESLNSPGQFSIDGYKMIKLESSEEEAVLTVDKIKTPVLAEVKESSPEQAPEAVPESGEFFKDFDLSMLDSIQSLTVFYAIFKNYNIEELDGEVKQKIDAKFNELVGQLQNPLKANEISFLSNISDSTYVRDDINNLLTQARMESQVLILQQSDFEEKTQLINDKLEVGFENLDAAERASLLEDLNKLEKLLTDNENRFYKNQNSYRQVINVLKDRFFNLEDLENKLSVSEAQRFKEQRIFRQRLLTILSIAVVFAIMVILLIYFSNKLKKQKEKLVLANDEIKRINENLEGIVFERTKMLEETNKELDTVLYRASHDLRSPVCSIIGLCNIATTVSNEESTELLEKVVQTTVGMDKLLKKLSIISEINNPKDLSPIKLSKAIKEIEQDFKQTIKDHRINFVVECPDDLVISSYPYLIEVILSNLIENALFFCKIKRSKHYRVILSVGMNENYLELSLYDNGIGVDSGISDRLFDMFFRGNEYSKGNGLGLYIVQKAVYALNGQIAVESDPGKFTRFVVQLPLEVVVEEEKEEVPALTT